MTVLGVLNAQVSVGGPGDGSIPIMTISPPLQSPAPLSPFPSPTPTQMPDPVSLSKGNNLTVARWAQVYLGIDIKNIFASPQLTFTLAGKNDLQNRRFKLFINNVVAHMEWFKGSLSKTIDVSSWITETGFYSFCFEVYDGSYTQWYLESAALSHIEECLPLVLAEDTMLNANPLAQLEFERTIEGINGNPRLFISLEEMENNGSCEMKITVNNQLVTEQTVTNSLIKWIGLSSFITEPGSYTFTFTVNDTALGNWKINELKLYGIIMKNIPNGLNGSGEIFLSSDNGAKMIKLRSDPSNWLEMDDGWYWLIPNRSLYLETPRGDIELSGDSWIKLKQDPPRAEGFINLHNIPALGWLGNFGLTGPHLYFAIAEGKVIKTNSTLLSGGIPPLIDNRVYFCLQYDENLSWSLGNISISLSPPDGNTRQTKGTIVLDALDPFLYIFPIEQFGGYKNNKIEWISGTEFKNIGFGASFNGLIPYEANFGEEIYPEDGSIAQVLPDGTLLPSFTGHLYLRGDIGFQECWLLKSGEIWVDVDANDDGSILGWNGSGTGPAALLSDINIGAKGKLVLCLHKIDKIKQKLPIENLNLNLELARGDVACIGPEGRIYFYAATSDDKLFKQIDNSTAPLFDFFDLKDSSVEGQALKVMGYIDPADGKLLIDATTAFSFNSPLTGDSIVDIDGNIRITEEQVNISGNYEIFENNITINEGSYYNWGTSPSLNDDTYEIAAEGNIAFLNTDFEASALITNSDGSEEFNVQANGTICGIDVSLDGEYSKNSNTITVDGTVSVDNGLFEIEGSIRCYTNGSSIIELNANGIVKVNGQTFGQGFLRITPYEINVGGTGSLYNASCALYGRANTTNGTMEWQLHLLNNNRTLIKASGSLSATTQKISLEGSVEAGPFNLAKAGAYGSVVLSASEVKVTGRLNLCGTYFDLSGEYYPQSGTYTLKFQASSWSIYGFKINNMEAELKKEQTTGTYLNIKGNLLIGNSSIWGFETGVDLDFTVNSTGNFACTSHVVFTLWKNLPTFDGYITFRHDDSGTFFYGTGKIKGYGNKFNSFYFTVNKNSYFLPTGEAGWSTGLIGKKYVAAVDGTVILKINSSGSVECRFEGDAWLLTRHVGSYSTSVNANGNIKIRGSVFGLSMDKTIDLW